MKKLCFSLTLLFLLATAATSSAQKVRSAWSFKTGLFGAVNDNLTFELERSIGERFSLSVRLGLSDPDFRRDEPTFDGFFLKAGPKFYLTWRRAPQTGLFVKPTFLYNRWRNWPLEKGGRFYEVYETSLGLIVEGGWSISFLERLRIEPILGFGVAPTWDSFKSLNDTAPFEELVTTWEMAEPGDIDGPPYSHLPLQSSLRLAFSVGLNMGIVF